MKPRCSRRRNQALKLLEVVVVIAVLVILAAMFLSALASSERNAERIVCANNLKQIGLGYRVWGDGHQNRYPMEVSVTDGGTREFCVQGDSIATFQVMSNELSTSKILYCRADTKHTPAVLFDQGFGATNISYLVDVDANPSRPDSILSGDDNFQLQSHEVRSGLVTLSTNPTISWTASRHLSLTAHFWTSDQNRFIGNIGFADGSAQQLTTIGLQQAFQQSGTNSIRLVIP
jgi:prepilin-type processing-associated H-X9-DG protein